MKTVALILTLVAFSIFKILYIDSSDTTPAIVFPTFVQPDIEFKDVSDGCTGFVDCIEFVGWVLFNIGAGIIFLITFLINLLVFVFRILAILVEVQFIGIDGAPWWVNIILAIPITGTVAMIIYKMARKGDTTD